MAVIKIAIIDDDEKNLDEVKKLVSITLENKNIPYEILCYKSSFELAYLLDENQDTYCDIYLLDIEMPGINGLQLAHKIQIKYRGPYLVFITNYKRYSIDGYEEGAYRYILKKAIEEKLPETLNSIISSINQKSEPYHIFESDKNLEKVLLTDIIYIESDKKYSIIHTNQKDIRIRESLKNVYGKLSDDRFAYCDQKYVINLEHLISIQDMRDVILRGEIVLPVSRPRLKQLKEAAMDFWKKDMGLE